MANTIRAFFAVNIPATPTLRTALADLASLGTGIKSVAAENLHVTLKFLGDIESGQVATVLDAVREVVVGQPACSLTIRGMGAFPRVTRPAVVWAGLAHAETLVTMANEFESLLQPLGFQPERRAFVPHLTLARVRNHPPEALLELLQLYETTDFGTADVITVDLIHSELRSEGPRYTVLESMPLVH